MWPDQSASFMEDGAVAMRRIYKERKQEATIRKREGDGEIPFNHLPNIPRTHRMLSEGFFQTDLWNIPSGVSD